MESIYFIRNLLPREAFMTTVDNKDAHLHVPIKHSVIPEGLGFVIRGHCTSTILRPTIWSLLSTKDIHKILTEALNGLRLHRPAILPEVTSMFH